MRPVDDPAAVVAGLNQHQLDAVVATGGPVVVLAGAGTGKTRVLTRRIAYRVATGEVDPARVMAVTFTRKAAAELADRLRILGLHGQVHAGTFHRLAYVQLRDRWAERRVTPPTLVGSRARIVRGLATSRSRIPAREVLTEIDWAAARLVDAEAYPAAAAEAGRLPPIPLADVADLLDRYRQEKRRRRMVDFDDLLILAIRDLRTDDGYAEAIRWRHRHLHVDEFQDVSPLQFELLAQWRGQRPDLFVVGDPNQAIYGWNGADPKLLDRFARREAGAVVVRLTENYRSRPQVLAVATAAADHGLIPTRPDGPAPTITAHADAADEAVGVAARVRAAHSVAGAWSDQAVLARTNAQLTVIEEALNRASIPTRVRYAGDDEPDPAAPSRPGGPAPEDPGDGDGDGDGGGDAVELTTFHGAKGLEWAVVHIAGLETGFVPIAYATTPAQRAEERRLLYVALTRAVDELHLSWARTRTFGEKLVGRTPSPWLGPLSEVVAAMGATPALRVDWRAGLAASRAALTPEPGPPDPGWGPAGTGADQATGRDSMTTLYRALDAGRSRRARAAPVPAAAVLPDRQRRQVAEAAPGTATALAGLPGMTPVRMARYGEDLLRVVIESRPVAWPDA
ncbi:MAG: UvrD-helicase domain-containing protein [Acidimicrobiales bacterium]